MTSIFFFGSMYSQAIIRFGYREFQNNQGLDKGTSADPRRTLGGPSADPRRTLGGPSADLNYTWRPEQGWSSGASARLALMYPGFDSWTRRHMRVEFAVGSLPCSARFFCGYSGFPLSSKTNIFKFQFDLDY